MDSSKALVPTQRFVPLPTYVKHVGDRLELSLRQYDVEVAFTLHGEDESDGIYGPDGKESVNPAKAEFVDTYV
jgi:hypothetical protein